MTYSFSLVILCPRETPYKDGLEKASNLLAQAGTDMIDAMPWSTDGASAILVHADHITHDVQPLLSRWLNEGEIVEYHIVRHDGKRKRRKGASNG